ncbi:hypothetical protein HDZ31DRAFT_45889 [Schizophyllum fasciatum]
MLHPLAPAPHPGTGPLVYLTSALEQRMREATKSTPYLPTAALLHAMYAAYSRQAVSSNTEFMARLKTDVASTVASLVEGGVSKNNFILAWNFGASYRRLWNAHQEHNETLGPAFEAWAEEREAKQWDIPDDGRTPAYFSVGEDLGKVLTFYATTFGDIFTPGNSIRSFVAKSIDPSITALYARLPNGALIEISWFEALPVPAPPFKREFHLELHRRGWRGAPKNILSLRPTEQCALLSFQNFLSHEPILINVPILDGGWILLGHLRRFLKKHGVVAPKGCVMMRSSTVNPSCLIEASWAEPVPVPPGSSIFLTYSIFCGACILLEPNRTLTTKQHFCTSA